MPGNAPGINSQMSCTIWGEEKYPQHLAGKRRRQCYEWMLSQQGREMEKEALFSS